MEINKSKTKVKQNKVKQKQNKKQSDPSIPEVHTPSTRCLSRSVSLSTPPP